MPYDRGLLVPKVVAEDAGILMPPPQVKARIN